MHRAVTTLALAAAWAGGAMLLGLVLLTCASIAGRELNALLQGPLAGMPGAGWLVEAGLGAVDGDFELLEAGIAFAVFAFLPICQLTGSHASVDLLADRLPPRVARWLRAGTELVFAAALVLIAVQLAAGMESKLRSGQTTLRLEFPVWWGYALALGPAVLAASTAAYVAVLRLAEAATGRALLPDTRA
jgi:TRAP-type C4-dicarboxylate transport system permease small subunit